MSVEIVYIVGSGRSGTTLLSRLLDLEHGYRAVGEVLALGDEGAWNLACGCGLSHATCPVWGPLIKTWSDPRRLSAWRGALRVSPREAMAAGGVHCLSHNAERGPAELRRVYESLAEPGTVLVDESKRPWLGWLLARQPWADVRFVELVRDPDDVIVSWSKTKDYAQEIPAEEVAKRWLRRRGATAGLRAVCRRPWLQIPYQQLANAPGSTLERVLGRRPEGLKWDGQEWAFTSPENHIYLSNPDKLRRGREVVRNLPPRPLHGMSARRGGIYQRTARRVYQQALRGAGSAW